MGSWRWWMPEPDGSRTAVGAGGPEADNQKWSNHPDWIAGIVEGKAQDIMVQRTGDGRVWRVTDEAGMPTVLDLGGGTAGSGSRARWRGGRSGVEQEMIRVGDPGFAGAGLGELGAGRPR